jgi:hypothetical protein
MIFVFYFKSLIITIKITINITMSINQTIAQAIDCPMMDGKNVAGIVESYCKYNILDENEVSSVEIEIYSDVHECEEFLFVYDGERYYMLEEEGAIDFVNGNPTTIDNEKKVIKAIVDNPERYVIIQEALYYRRWRICKTYNTFEAFRRVYKAQIYKWYRLINPDLIDDLITFRFMGTHIYSSTNNNGDTVELTPAIRDRIICLFDVE